MDTDVCTLLIEITALKEGDLRGVPHNYYETMKTNE